MFVEIHFPEQLPVDRDELEDAISDEFGDAAKRFDNSPEAWIAKYQLCWA